VGEGVEVVRFEIRPPFIVFHDDKPGQHAVLYASDDRRFPFCDEASSFSDVRREYAWAFEGAVAEGDHVVFTTSDREVVGRVRGDEIVVGEVSGVVSARDEGRAPIVEVGAPFPLVASLLQPPHPPSPSRPVPMPRSTPPPRSRLGR
jgi:hypothetical protein